MKILQISVGRPRTVEFDGKTIRTGIFKEPVAGPVTVGLDNVDGDQQADLRVHGGRDKAVYAYSADYAGFWMWELGRSHLEAAQFGENLTISGGPDSEVVVGSRYRVGEVELTVMQPRIPCHKLGARLGDKTFPQRFWQAGRLGFYLRVERTGSIEAGQGFELLYEPQHAITLRELYRVVVDGRAADAVRVSTALPGLDDGWKRRLRAATRR